MVTRCVCFDVPFTRLKTIIEEEGVQDTEELHRRIQFGEKCRLCAPYVERIFVTGETEFEVIQDEG